jgi:hypothetical protein
VRHIFVNHRGREEIVRDPHIRVGEKPCIGCGMFDASSVDDLLRSVVLEVRSEEFTETWLGPVQ